MKRNKFSDKKKGKQSSFNKLSIFQNNKFKFKKSCPLSVKGAPKIDYKNLKLLKNIPLKMEKYYLQGSQIYIKYKSYTIRKLKKNRFYR